MEQTDLKVSYWDNPKFHETDMDIWTPSHTGDIEVFRVIDWDNIQLKTYENGSRNYIETDIGWLRIDSVRVNRALVEHRGYKKELVMQRWVEKGNTRNTKYLIQKKSEVKELSNKK